MADVAYVALGSNLGDRDAHLRTARARIAALPETRLAAGTYTLSTPAAPPATSR